MIRISRKLFVYYSQFSFYFFEEEEVRKLSGEMKWLISIKPITDVDAYHTITFKGVSSETYATVIEDKVEVLQFLRKLHTWEW